MNTRDVNIYDDAAMEAFRKEGRFDPELLRTFRNRLFKKFVSNDDASRVLPNSADLKLHSLELFQRKDSELDGATKLLFRTDANLLIESVILRITPSESAGQQGPGSRRSTVCVSSQVGCAAACDFCATGKMGIARNLSAAEILDQVVQTGQILATEDRRLNNIVFMGMGEPFHNEQQLYEAITALTSPQKFDKSPRSILVSTVGIPGAMVRFAKQFPNVNMALSLHSADQAVRRQLIPLAEKHPLDELKDALKAVNAIRDEPVMIEYLMLHELNDSAEDADQLVNWLRDVNTRVNLIPYNAIDESPHLVASSPEVISAFSSRLKSAGIETTTRYSLGRDIAAACGQLVRKSQPGASRRSKTRT